VLDCCGWSLLPEGWVTTGMTIDPEEFSASPTLDSIFQCDAMLT